MNYDDAFTLINELLIESQRDLSDEFIEIDKDTSPFLDIEGFDSLAAVCITAQCYEKMGISVDAEADNIFIGKNTNGETYGLKMDAVVKKFLKIISENKENEK